MIASDFPQTVSDNMLQTSDKLFCLNLLDAALSNSEVDSSDLPMYLVVRRKQMRQAEFVKTHKLPKDLSPLESTSRVVTSEVN